ncbi:MAG: hypothetical protein K0S58_84 [Nitrospira sp.]|nr:hypothetical protein [Nitrospira sp.]
MATSFTERAQTLCPRTECKQLMEPDPRVGYDGRTGLQSMRCCRCGHFGLKALQGVQLLFAGKQAYVFGYGPSLSSLKVVLSTVALNLFRGQGVPPIQMATYVAEWALLMGQACGTVQPSGDLVLSSCYEYCHRQVSQTAGVSSR